VEASDNLVWYRKIKWELLSQKEAICNASNEEMPDRDQRYREVIDELEKLERWKRACSITPSSP